MHGVGPWGGTQLPDGKHSLIPALPEHTNICRLLPWWLNGPHPAGTIACLSAHRISVHTMPAGPGTKTKQPPPRGLKQVRCVLEGIPDPAQSLLLAHMCVDGCLNAPTEALTQHNPGPRCLSADGVRPDIAGCGARPGFIFEDSPQILFPVQRCFSEEVTYHFYQSDNINLVCVKCLLRFVQPLSAWAALFIVPQKVKVTIQFVVPGGRCEKADMLWALSLVACYIWTP